MTSSQPKRLATIMDASRNTLAFYALIVVIVEAILGVAVLRLSGMAQIATIAGMILVLVLVIVIAGYRWTSPGEVMPSVISSLWSVEDLPIPEDIALYLKGRWNCRWTYHTASGELDPYVYDRVDIQELDIKTGDFTGEGLSVYGPDADYKVFGKISKRQFMILFYTTPPPKMGISGMAMLKLSHMGKLEGWWLGGGREGGTVGGQVIWIQESEDPEFIPEYFPIETDSSVRE